MHFAITRKSILPWSDFAANQGSTSPSSSQFIQRYSMKPLSALLQTLLDKSSLLDYQWKGARPREQSALTTLVEMTHLQVEGIMRGLTPFQAHRPGLVRPHWQRVLSRRQVLCTTLQTSMPVSVTHVVPNQCSQVENARLTGQSAVVVLIRATQLQMAGTMRGLTPLPAHRPGLVRPYWQGGGLHTGAASSAGASNSRRSDPKQPGGFQSLVSAYHPRSQRNREAGGSDAEKNLRVNEAVACPERSKMHRHLDSFTQQASSDPFSDTVNSMQSAFFSHTVLSRASQLTGFGGDAATRYIGAEKWRLLQSRQKVSRHA